MSETHRDRLYIYQNHVDALYRPRDEETLQTLTNFHYCPRFALPYIDPKRIEWMSCNFFIIKRSL